MTATKFSLIAVATAAATIGMTACSPSTTSTGPSTTTVTAPATTTVSTPSTTAMSEPAPTSSSAPAVGQGSDCEVNPSSAPMPTAEPYGTVPEVGRISVALNGITSGSVTAGSAPTEVEVTLCNNSAVSYPEVGVVLTLQHCSCAPNPMLMPTGTVERFDPAANSWIQMEHPVEGGGMDYLGGYSDVQELPKGKSVTLRYRIALDASMNAGDGGVAATAVAPDPLSQLGRANLPFTVVK
jgi:hypothetical protein